MQKILEAESHTERLRLVRYFVEAETKRLNTKKALKGMFSGGGGDFSDAEKIPPEEQLAEENKSTSKRSIFTDEPDAFQ